MERSGLGKKKRKKIGAGVATMVALTEEDMLKGA